MKTCKKCGLEKPLDGLLPGLGHAGRPSERLQGLQPGRRSRQRYLADPEAANRPGQALAAGEPRAGERVPAARGGAKPEVKRAERAGHLKRKYGITIEQYDELLASAGRWVCDLRAGTAAGYQSAPRPRSRVGAAAGHPLLPVQQRPGRLRRRPRAAAGGHPLPRVVPADRRRGGPHPGAGPAAAATGLRPTSGAHPSQARRAARSPSPTRAGWRPTTPSASASSPPTRRPSTGPVLLHRPGDRPLRLHRRRPRGPGLLLRVRLPPLPLRALNPPPTGRHPWSSGPPDVCHQVRRSRSAAAAALCRRRSWRSRWSTMASMTASTTAL